ncbi:hypothetical protein [Nonomuraea dietziae]|uniref:hypothetical protein n=1 Tax=Nonomuraea dietziae TaxID=65515 RepID=UPI0033D912C5
MTVTIDTVGAGVLPAPAGRENGSSLYLAGRLLEAIGRKLSALGSQALAATREDGKPVLPVDDRQTGYMGPTRLGYTQMYDGKVTPELAADHPALVAWALANDHYRNHVITTQTLAPATVKALKDHAAKVGQPVDKHGEVVPGLTLRKGDPTPYQKLDEQLVAELIAPERIQALAWALLSGTATLPGLSAHTSAETPEGASHD